MRLKGALKFNSSEIRKCLLIEIPELFPLNSINVLEIQKFLALKFLPFIYVNINVL